MADELSSGSDSGTGGGAADSGAAAASQPITLTETSSFIPPGGKEPLTWDKFQSGYVSKDDLTRMRQRDASERQAWQQTERQRIEQELRQQAQAQQTQTQQTGQTSDFLTQLEAAPFVDGKTVAGIVRQVAQQLSQSQHALQILHQQNQQLRQQVTGISGKWSQTELQSMFGTTKAKLGLPDDPIIDELLQDVYHSHTGWETDPQAFETTVSTRWKGIQSAIRNADRQRADQARQQNRPFAPGGPGGVAKPSQPLLKGGESAEEIARRMWPGSQSVST